MRFSNLVDELINWVRIKFSGKSHAIIQTVSAPVAFSIFFGDRHGGPWVCQLFGIRGEGILIYYGVVAAAWLAYAWDLNR